MATSTNLVQANSRDTEHRSTPVASNQFRKSTATTLPQNSVWSRRVVVKPDPTGRTVRPAPTATPVVVSTKAPPVKAVTPEPVVDTAPVVSTPPEQTDASDTSFTALIQQKVTEYTNAEREKAGLVPLSSDSALAMIAQKHSADMLANDFFSHTNKSGCDTRCRIDAADYKWKSYGENIHWMSGYSYSASEAAHMVVNAWMDSKGHRENILNSTFTHIGVGVDIKGTAIYTTADYAMPK